MKEILTALLLFTFISCGQTTANQESKGTTVVTNPKWKTFDGANCSIQYPPEWELNQSGQMGTSLILYSPLDSSKDQFRTNVNLIIQDLSGRNIDLDKFAEISEGQVKTMITNSSLIESKRIKSASEEHHRMIYTGDQGIYHLEFEQYYWVNNDKAFILTLTSEKNKFSGYKGMGEAILNSFTFKK